MSKIDTNKKNIDRLYDLYYKSLGDITSLVTRIINSLGVMKKSDYATNEKSGVVDKSDSATCGDNNTIRFGIDPNGKWGYIKDDGADTVIPFKTGGSGEMQDKTASASTTQQVITPDSGYDGLSSVTINAATKQSKTITPTSQQQIVTPDSGYYGLEQVTVEPSPGVNLQSKTASASTSQQIIQPDSGYDGLSSVTIDAATKQEKTITPTSQQQIVTPDSGYYGLSRVIVNASAGANLQVKTTTVTPGANWSGTETSPVSITPDSGYDGMSQVNVKTPMIRDNCLMVASTVDTPGTVYNGDTAESNSQKLLRVAPSKTGMAYTNSYLYLKPSSYLGDADPSDVKSGKKFTSASGIQQTGTAASHNIQSYKNLYLEYPWEMTFDGLNIQDVTPDSGYDALGRVEVFPPYMYTTVLWDNPYNVMSATGAFTADFNSWPDGSQSIDPEWDDADLIRITYIPDVNNYNPSSPVKFYWIAPVSEIKKINNTSTNQFSISGKAITSYGSTSGQFWGRLFRFASKSTVVFTTGQRLNAATTGTRYMLPIRIEKIGNAFS